VKHGLGRNCLCIAHGGGKRCEHSSGCTNSVQGANGMCVAHGGGKRILLELLSMAHLDG
jgi:hypothetical protein